MARYFTIIQLALIVAIAYAGTAVFYRIVVNQLDTVPIFHGSEADQPVSQAQNDDNRAQPITHYQTAIDRNLFKTPSKELVKTDSEVDVKTLQQTKLGLKLWGTVHGRSNKTYAVIEEKATRKQRLFSVGDQVESASVEMILREKVVLGVNGKKEILAIERPVTKGRRAASKAIRPPPSGGDLENTGDKEGKEVVIQRSRIEDAIQNVNQLMKHVRIRPHFTNGKPDGLRLTGVRPGTIFTDIGFRNGDIITGVNGKPIESVDDALKFYTSLKNSSNVDLQIRRRGQDKSIQYRVED